MDNSVKPPPGSTSPVLELSRNRSATDGVGQAAPAPLQRSRLPAGARNKLTTAAGAMALVRSGDRVWVQQGSGAPASLLDALAARAAELVDVEIAHMLTLGPLGHLRSELAGHLRHNALFIGENARAAVAEGRADYTPVALGDIEHLFEDALRIDIALVQTSPPDQHGFLSLGTGPDCTLTAARRARHVVVEIRVSPDRRCERPLGHRPEQPNGGDQLGHPSGPHGTGLCRLHRPGAVQRGGGQPDFIRGALRSRGGRSVIALPSTAQQGSVSRIVPVLDAGAGVVCTRADVDEVVTEYGVAHLRGRTLRQRAEALISIAHPRFRDELWDFAVHHHHLVAQPAPV